MKRYILLFLVSFQLGASEKLKFFNLDMHISVIADVKDIFESFGHEVDAWSISGHTWVFGKKRDRVEIYNEKTAASLNREMCDRFYERYREELEGYDAFIVTHSPSTSLLYEKWHKPIIIVNSTRYEQPFTDRPAEWLALNDYLRKGVENGQIFIVSNNKGDQSYLKHYTGLDSELIPSLCRYTRSSYTGTKKGAILHSWSGNYFFNIVKKAFASPQLVQNSSLPHPYPWQTLYDFQAIVHFPYQISVMSLFEQYTANVPLFFPSKSFLMELYKDYPDTILSQLSFFPLLHLSPPQLPGDPNNLDDPSVLDFWIDSADYYDEAQMPYIQYFDSFTDLEFQLEACDLQAVSQKMQAHNIRRKELIMQKWERLLKKLTALATQRKIN